MSCKGLPTHPFSDIPELGWSITSTRDKQSGVRSERQTHDISSVSSKCRCLLASLNVPQGTGAGANNKVWAHIWDHSHLKQCPSYYSGSHMTSMPMWRYIHFCNKIYWGKKQLHGGTYGLVSGHLTPAKGWLSFHCPFIAGHVRFYHAPFMGSLWGQQKY